MMHRSTLLLAALAVVLLAAACAQPAAPAVDDDRLQVATDVPPVTNIVENIGGDRISLRGMIPMGVSSHGFEPPPGDVRHLTTADLLIFNGLALADPTYRLAETNRKDGAVLVYLGDEVLPEEEWIFDVDFPAEEGQPNPHVWMDPLRALRYAEVAHEQLVAVDPDNADYYGENLDRFRAAVTDLDRRAAEAFETVPPEHRKLLTYHDCCPYMAQRYGLEVIAAVQPADFGQPSAAEVARIIDQIRELELPAVFGSDLFPSPVMDQIAAETGAAIVYGLEDDMLPGEPGDPEFSYLGMMVENFVLVVESLGGSAEALEGFDPGPVFEGESGAIY